MSKAISKVALVVIPLTLLGVIQLASVSPKLMQLDIQTPVGGVSFNTSENGIKYYRKFFFRDSKRC